MDESLSARARSTVPTLAAMCIPLLALPSIRYTIPLLALPPIRYTVPSPHSLPSGDWPALDYARTSAISLSTTHTPVLG